MCEKGTWYVLSAQIDILEHEIYIEYTKNIHYIAVTRKVGQDHIYILGIEFH